MKKIILISLMLFLMISCALESKFGLPNNEKINNELIGTWIAPHLKFGEKESDSLIIIAKNDKSYELIFDDKERLISHSMTIKGFNILNIISESKNGKINTFYGFEIKNDTLKFTEVTDKLRKNDFNSQTELIDFFNENIEKSNFFINPDIMIRK